MCNCFVASLVPHFVAFRMNFKPRVKTKQISYGWTKQLVYFTLSACKLKSIIRRVDFIQYVCVLVCKHFACYLGQLYALAMHQYSGSLGAVIETILWRFRFTLCFTCTFCCSYQRGRLLGTDGQGHVLPVHVVQHVGNSHWRWMQVIERSDWNNCSTHLSTTRERSLPRTCARSPRAWDRHSP